MEGHRAVKVRATRNKRSIAAEVLDLLETFVPTDAEVQRRREFVKWASDMRSHEPLTPGPFPSSEEMIREDRER
jgi:plasmid stability protein